VSSGTFSLEQAAAACGLQPSWTRDSSWFIASTFNECRFRREILSLDAALRLHACWHTVGCAQFDSGRVVLDGGANAIRDINPAELPLSLTLMACSVHLALSKRPAKFGRFGSELVDRDALMAMDGNHRLAALARRRARGEPDLVPEVTVYVCR
jgi:hypothetical protein